MRRREVFIIPALALLFVLGSSSATGGSFTATASGAWNSSGTWGEAGVPGAGDLAVIPAGITVTISSGLSAYADSIVVRGSLSFAANSAQLDVSGSVLNSGSIGMGSGGTLRIGRRLIASGGTFSPGTASGSTVEFNGTGAQQIPGYQFYNLTVSNGAAVVSTEGNVSVRGRLDVRAGAVLSPRYSDKIMPLGVENILTGSGTVQVTYTGTVSNPTKSNGHFGEQYQLTSDSLANLTVEYAGTAAQSVTSLLQYYPITYGKLKVSNTAGVALAGDISVAGELVLMAGSVSSGSFVLSIASTGSVRRTGGHVAGTLARWAAAGDPVVRFDIGSGGAYAPVEIAFRGVTAPGTVRAFTVASAHPSLGTSPLIAARSVRRYWAIAKGGLVYGDCDITLEFPADDIPAGADPMKFEAARYSSGAWSSVGGGAATGTSVRAAGMTGFGDFAAGEAIPSPPPPPVLSLPEDGALVGRATPALVWTAAPRASTYTVELSADQSFLTLLARIEGITGTSVACSPPLTPGTTAFWRITAVNDGGAGTSAAWSFGVVPPPSRSAGLPVEGATEVSTTPTFRWDQAENATGYRLQVSSSPDFTGCAVNQTMTGNSYSVPRGARLLSGTGYYWRCRAVYGIGESAWGDAWTFTTRTGPTAIVVNAEWAGHQIHDIVDGHEFGVDAFAAIQPAVDAAPEEATVQIAPGLYQENVTVRRKMYIIGSGGGSSGTTLDGGGIGPCITLQGEGISIEGAAFQHGTEGVAARAAGIVLKGCRIEKNRGAGVALSGADYGDIHGNIIADNGGDGVLVSGSRHAAVLGNMLSGNGTNIHVARQDERSSLGAVIEANTLRAAIGWDIFFEGDPATAAVRFNVFGPEGIDQYIWNGAEGSLDARDNWFGGKNPAVATDFQGEVAYTALPADAVTVGVFPADHAIPMDGKVMLPVMALVPQGRAVKGTSVVLGWDRSKLQPVEGIERGYFFGNRADTGGEEWFTWQPENPDGQIIVDQAVLGGGGGAAGGNDGVPYVGTLFTVGLKPLAPGADMPALSSVLARDQNNQPLAPLVVRSEGSILIDAAPPVIASVRIDNTTLGTDRDGDGRDDYIRDGQSARVSATISDDGRLLATDVRADLNALQGGAGHSCIYPGEYDEGTHRGEWTVERTACHPAEGQVSATITATDRAGNSTRSSAAIVADNTAPSKVTGFSAAPGHGKVTVSWTNGSDNNALKGTVVRYARWNGYPVYPEGSGPAYPGSPTAGDGEAGNVPAPGSGLVHACPARDIYCYAAFAYDWAGNYSAADAESRDRSTSYFLGDLGSGSGLEIPGGGGYDGIVNYMDLWWFSDLYYTEGNWAYGTAREADIGPTAGSKLFGAYDRFGLPAPDGRVDFEDLMIFAMNYANTIPKPAAGGIVQNSREGSGGGPALILQGVRKNVQPGEECQAALFLSTGGQPVKGCSVLLRYDPDRIEVLQAVRGGLLGRPDQGAFFTRAGKGTIEIDAAILGAGTWVDGSGELAAIRFLAKAGGGVDMDISRADVRDQKNRQREISLDKGGDPIPGEFMLRQNYPNPFNGMTSIAYDVPAAEEVAIDIYNIIGEKVVRLVEGGHTPGRYRAVWDGASRHGEQCASGVYFCMMKAGGYSCVRKLLLTR